MTDVINKVKKTVIGNPRDLNDSSTFHQISLIVFLAWVGLGSDALSSSCYGPKVRSFHSNSGLPFFSLRKSVRIAPFGIAHFVIH